MYPVTKPRLPDLGRYMRYLEAAHERGRVTNFGPLHEELTERLEAYLGVQNLLLVANGTLALHIAYRALGLSGKIITTPFSFVATTSTLEWEGLDPAFVDIDGGSLNLDPALLDAAPAASGIVAVHVYGNPCDVEAIDAYAAPRGIKVVYDAAHAFGSEIDGKSVLGWGDASTLSFHATKLFHTIEGGAIIFRRREDYELARRLINFGQDDAGRIGPVGTNAKLSEYHAAAGLALLDATSDVIAERAGLVATYQRALDGWAQFQSWHPAGRNNGAYMPMLLESEAQCLALHERLVIDEIYTRRYFYPSLNRLDFAGEQAAPCPIGEDVASRILCLPLYAGLGAENALHIAERVKACLR